MPSTNHNKLIQQVATKTFTEFGIKQKGNSRTWLDDNYWFTTIIEFQPFKDGPGTGLNVGANFHWYEKDFFSFDIGYRASEFISYINDIQFENELKTLVNLALRNTLTLRSSLRNIEIAQETILNHQFASDNLWGNYHRAIITGLNNKPIQAKQLFNSILEHGHSYDWQSRLKQQVENLIIKLDNPSEFQNTINSTIERSRRNKKLLTIEVNNVW